MSLLRILDWLIAACLLVRCRIGSCRQRVWRRRALRLEVLDPRWVLADVHTVVYDVADQLVAVYHDAVSTAPQIMVTVNGAGPVSGDQVRIAQAVRAGSADQREVFVVDTNGYLRAVHLDSDQAAGLQDPFGGSVVLGPTMVLNSGSQGSDFALSPMVQTLDIITPNATNGDITLRLTGTAVSSSGPVPGLGITWTLTIPNTTPAGTPPGAEVTKVRIEQAAHFASSVALSAAHLANAEGFRVSRFSNSYVDAAQTTIGTTTHDADTALALGPNGNLLRELDLATVPRGALLVSGGVAGATEIQLQQRRPALLNDDPPNMRLRLVAPNNPGDFRAQGFVGNAAPIDENSDNVDWYISQQFANPTISAGTDLNWMLEVTAEDGGDLLPQTHFLHDQAKQYTHSANPSDFGQPMIPVFTNAGDGGMYLQDILNGGVNDSANDPDVFRGRSSYRMTLTQLGTNGFAIFKLGSSRPRDIPAIGLAKQLRFAAQGDTNGQQLEVKVVTGDGTELNLGSARLVTLTSAWSEYSIALPSGIKASEVAELHFVLNPANPQGLGTVRLDEIRLSTDGFDPLRVLQSYVPLDLGGNERDADFYRDSAFVYDNALAIKALLAAGDSESRALARNIGDAILLTQQMDGSFFDRLTSGHVANAGGVRGSFGERRAGDNLFIGLSLLELARVFPADPRYYAGAVAISNWVETELRASGALGGYFGGLRREANGSDTLLNFRATEHNLDAFEFHRQLGDMAEQRGETANAALWRSRATHAGEFVVAMFDATEGKFWTGANALDSINTSTVPSDVQFWAQQTLGMSVEFGSRLDYGRAIDWAIANLSITDGPLDGFSFSTGAVMNSPIRVWLEGTAHAAVSFQLLGTAREADRDTALATLRLARLTGAADGNSSHDGLGVPASSRDGLIDPSFPDLNFDDRLHVAASAWAFFAAAGFSPFQPLALNDAPSFTKGPNQTGTAINDEAGEITVPNWATNLTKGPPDEANQTLTFFVSVPAAQQALFAALPAIDGVTGTLTFTPAANMKGTATVTVVLSDDGGGTNSISEAQQFTIDISKPHPWHNSGAGAFGNLDVNGKDGITLIDAQMVINYLNSAPPAGQGNVPASAFGAPAGVPLVGYIDVAIDAGNANFISTLDAVRVINFLNTPGGEGEGERERNREEGIRGQVEEGLEEILALLAVDAEELGAKRRRGW